MLYVELAVVLVLFLINGLLAMAELAVVSSRRSRLQALASQGVVGARRALALASNPGKFLSSVQIGITLVGVLSGAFSGATLGLRLVQLLIAWGMPTGVAEPLGLGLVVAAITYVSLIVGELVPKQIALRNPERVAAKVAPAMTILAKIASPLVWFLDISGRTALHLLGYREQAEHRVSDEEIRSLMAEAEFGGCDRARRTGDDRRRDAPRRPAGSRRHDSASRSRHGGPLRLAGRHPQDDPRQRSFPPAGL